MFVSVAYAQTWDPTPLSTGSITPAVVTVAAIMVTICVLLVVGIRLLDRMSRRELEAAQLQWELTELLDRDPALSGLYVLPTTRKDFQGRLTVELQGEVPSVWHRWVAQRSVAREFNRRGVKATILNRVGVMPGQRVIAPRKTA